MRTLRRFSPCLLLCLAVVILPGMEAAAELRITGETKVEPYRLVELRAEGAAEDAGIVWDVVPEEAADSREFPGGHLLFAAPPGVYRVKCRSIQLKGGKTIVETARVTVTIGTPPPPVPPVPPVPPDSLTLALQTAWAQETGPNRLAEAKQLAALYRQAITTIDDAKIQTGADLLGVLRQASASLLPETALPKVRRAVADYLNAEIGVNAGNALDKPKARAAFKRLADATEGLR